MGKDRGYRTPAGGGYAGGNIVSPCYRVTCCALVMTLQVASLAIGRGAFAAEDYATLQARVAQGDFSVDFRALRMAYARTAAYQPNNSQSLRFRQQVQQALQAKDYAQALHVGEAWLADDFLNPFAQMGVARAYEAIGQAEQSRLHNRIAEEIFESICRAGEGFSPDAPCPVLSIDEQHFFLIKHGFEMGAQYGATCKDDHPCDVYEVRKPGGSLLQDVYFDISLPYARAAESQDAAPTGGTR
jgi:hypothetical protein